MKTLLHTMFIVAALGLAGAGLTACHTTEGAARDVQAAGEGVEDAARDNRPYDEGRR